MVWNVSRNAAAGPATAAAAAAAAEAAIAAARAAARRGWHQSDDTILAATRTLGQRWISADDGLCVVKAIDCGTGTAHLMAAELHGFCLVESGGALTAVELGVPAGMRVGASGLTGPFAPPDGYTLGGFLVSGAAFDDSGAAPLATVGIPGAPPVSGESSGRGAQNLAVQLPGGDELNAPGWHDFEGATVRCWLYETVGHGSVFRKAEAGGSFTTTAVRCRYRSPFGYMEVVITAGRCSLVVFELDPQDLMCVSVAATRPALPCLASHKTPPFPPSLQQRYCGVLAMHGEFETMQAAVSVCKRSHTVPEIRASILATRGLVTEPKARAKLQLFSDALALDGAAAPAPVAAAPSDVDAAEHDWLELEGRRSAKQVTPTWGNSLDAVGWVRLPGYTQESLRLCLSQVWRLRAQALFSQAGGMILLPNGLLACNSASEAYLLVSDPRPARPNNLCHLHTNTSPGPCVLLCAALHCRAVTWCEDRILLRLDIAGTQRRNS
jgi:hypothetical protein